GGGYGTALQAASANGKVEVVQLLLKIHRTDIRHYVNLWGGHYGSALCAACANEHTKIAQLLVDNGAMVTFYGQLPNVKQTATEASQGNHLDPPFILLR
ncbi:hypothetical protein B0H14DRAFT_2334248, partial [Mycena olivaceomarginata]